MLSAHENPHGFECGKDERKQIVSAHENPYGFDMREKTNDKQES